MYKSRYKKKSYYTIKDQFCGGGGASQGAKQAAVQLKELFGVGIEVTVAINHWQLAIDTHNTNFPKIHHDCTDASACDPRRYPSTDMLITSPECTKHSPASGKKRNKYQNDIDLFGFATVKPEEERSRATMWDVPRFAEVHNYNHIIVENVVEAHEWVLFQAWLKAMKALDYNFKMCFLNSQFFDPCPQSRDRMYIVFWKKGLPKPDLEFRPNAYCTDCGGLKECFQSWKNPQKKWGKYNTQYIYRCSGCNKAIVPIYSAAFNAIDWSLPGTKISERPIALSPKTTARAQFGLDKYGNQPIVINTAYTHAGPNFGHSTLTDSLPTQTTKEVFSLCFPPLIVENQGQSKSRPVTERMACLTTNSKFGLLVDERMNSFLSYYYSNFTKTSPQASHILMPMNTVTTVEGISLIQAKPKLEDCFYRMLQIHEAQKAMAFPEEYILLGSIKDKMRLLGNAVTPPTEEWLITQCISSII
jgi:DNA (cytosine-5)-methyltransferase 1